MNHSARHKWVAGFLLVLVCATYTLLALKFPYLYILATYEDLLGEWTQLFLFLTAGLLSLRCARRHSRFNLFFVLLALGTFYTAGEEISWGQRLLDLETPAFFERHNLQGEMNFHNLFTGPVNTPLKRAVEVGMASGLILFGLAYPLALALKWRPAFALRRAGIPSPPLYLWLFFVLGALLQLRLLRSNEAEISELLVGLALCIFLLHHLAFRKDDPRPGIRKGRRAERISSWLASRIAAVFLLSLTLASAATALTWSNPRLQQMTASRVLNGVEKFAHRHERRGQWERAAQLWTIVGRERPDDAEILRRLAFCSRQMGNGERFLFFNDLALEADLRTLESSPGGIFTHISLADTYWQRGLARQAGRHEEKALMLARARFQDAPDDPRNAYGLARVYAVLGDASALAYFRKAYELQPDSRKYRMAYLKAGKQYGQRE